MRSEKEFSSFVLAELNSLHSINGIQVCEGKNILTDVTCIYEKDKFELIHGFAQTDIAFFTEIKFDANKHASDLIRFYGDTDIKKGLFAVPFVVLELKCGDVTTDSIRSRDFVAARIKEMFPFCAYYLLAENTKKEEKTLLRQGKDFTNYFISKDEFSKDEIKQIFTTYINPHIINVKRQFKII
ncbi:MAG: hypothetical protein HYZ42_04245 [Bacteroidetes bacterium]|nr:hypothetical protein [Bacteroidota bacterium]